MILSLNSLLIVVLCVATAGLGISRVFQWINRPYLLTVSGPPARLVAARALVWLSAAFVSLVSSVVLFSVLPLAIAMAIFFGLEAVMLDICGQRIHFQLQPMAQRIASVPSRPVRNLF